jgi:hypothetical protein
MKSLTILLTLCFAAAQAWSAPKTSTMAEQRGLIFSHTLHVESNGLDCATCHVGVEKSRTGGDNLLAGHSQCAACHDVAAPSTCTMCHLSATPAPQPPISDYSAKFGHLTHVASAKLECAACHQDLDTPAAADHRGHFPSMSECMACHEQHQVSTACATCHTSTENLKPRDHLVNWLNSHGTEASLEQESRCNQCHNRIGSKAPDCQNCHNGDPVVSPHPRNYMSRHGQDAHLTDVTCTVCHEGLDDCNTCHREMNVYPSNHQRAGWAIPGEGGEHTSEAAADLESCMSCHETPGHDPVCVRCHGK